MSLSGVMAIGGEAELNIGRLQLVDVATGGVLHDLVGHENIVVAVALSPSGRFLASGSYDSSLRLWDAVSGEQLLCIWGHSSFGGTCICDIRRWDYRTTGSDRIDFAVVKSTCPAVGHSGGVNTLAFSSCGKWLASGGGSGSLIVWDAATGTATARLIGEELQSLDEIHTCDDVMAVAFTPDTALLASGGELEGVVVWDWRAGTKVHSFYARYGDMLLSFSPDSRTLVVSMSNAGVQFWDLGSENPEDTMIDLDGLECGLLSPDGLTLATGDRTGCIDLQDATTMETRHELLIDADRRDVPFKMAFHPDGGVFAAVPFMDRSLPLDPKSRGDNP